MANFEQVCRAYGNVERRVLVHYCSGFGGPAVYGFIS
jgi:hypothetical protein